MFIQGMCAACMLKHACLCMGFRDLSCAHSGYGWRSFIHQVALRCAQLGASRCDCPRLCLVHTLWYDRARPRPRLSDRAGLSLCKSYEIVDSMVEATCLWNMGVHHPYH